MKNVILLLISFLYLIKGESNSYHRGYIIAERYQEGFIYSTSTQRVPPIKIKENNSDEKKNHWSHSLTLPELYALKNESEAFATACYEECYQCFCDHAMKEECEHDCFYCADWEWFCPQTCRPDCCQQPPPPPSKDCKFDCCYERYPQCRDNKPPPDDSCTLQCCEQKYPSPGLGKCDWNCCQEFIIAIRNENQNHEQAVFNVDCNPTVECNCEFGNMTQLNAQLNEIVLEECLNNNTLLQAQLNECEYNQTNAIVLEECTNNNSLLQAQLNECEFNQTSECQQTVDDLQFSCNQNISNLSMECKFNISILEYQLNECSTNTGDINCSNECSNSALTCTNTCVNLCLGVCLENPSIENCTTCIQNCLNGCNDQNAQCQASNCGTNMPTAPPIPVNTRNHTRNDTRN